MTPGQLGPMRRMRAAGAAAAFISSSTARARTMSLTGMPSVMQQMTLMPASAASRMASAARPGGTKIMVAVAPVFLTAWWTVSKTGTDALASISNFWPPLPGVTPPTSWVP